MARGANAYYEPALKAAHRFLCGARLGQDYWVRNGYFGGRSIARRLRMEGQSLVSCLASSLESSLKFVFWMVASWWPSSEFAFERKYKSVAHAGYVVEYVTVVFRALMRVR